MTAVIFRDKGLQARFERDGYVVFDFISSEQAALIAGKFFEVHDQIPKRFYSTAESADDAFKKAISDYAERIIAPSMEEVFQGYKKLGITFLSKAPGPEGKVPVHRDWMVVDESKYFSGTIWVPTSDVNEANGALKVWPGSHKFFNQLRSSSIPVAYEGFEDEIWDQMVTVPMKAGQAFLLNHAVIHASSANVTDKPRVILVCGIIPADAKLSYYHGTDHGTVEKFDMPDDMFMKHSEIGGRPTVGVKVEEFEYKVERENRLKIQQLLTSSRVERIAMPTFADEEMQSRFSKSGYFKMPLLSEVEVDSLKDMLEGHIDTGPTAEFIERVKQLIAGKVNFSNGMMNVLDVKIDIKRKCVIELENLHQELSCVENEEKYCSVTCRIALTDVSLTDGAPGFLTGSHLFLGNKRPSPEQQGGYKFKGHQFDVFPYLQTVEMKAGEAVFFDDRVFHGALSDFGDKDVVYVTVKMVNKNAQLCHYCLNLNGEPDSMIKYLVDDSFFQNYDSKQLSTLYAEQVTGYEPAETISFKYPEFTTRELFDLLKAEGGIMNGALVEQLMKLDAYKYYVLERDAMKAVVPSTENITVRPTAVVSAIEAKDDRDFWNTYSPLNIMREIKKRVLG